MKELPRISEAEWDVMSVVWAHEPVTAQEVHQHLVGQRDWNQRTVKTLIGRLVKKGVLEFEEDGKRYLYSARVAREACVRAENRSFVDRVHGGEASPMLAYFLRHSQLSKAEIDELKRLLDAKEAK